MLDGLEVTEIKLSEMLIDNEDFRYDSDFFKKIYLQSYKRLKELKADYLGNLSTGIKSFGAYSLTNQVSYLDSGIPFIRCTNIKDGVVDFSNVLFIDKEANKLLWKSEVKPGMVLLTMSGSIGNCAVALDTWEYPMNSNQDVAKISLQKGMNPYFVSTFLNTKYGQQQINRFSVGSVQQHIFLWQLEKLLIPKLSDDFQKQIEKTVKSAHVKLEQSKRLYAEAEETLLEELGLKNWSPPKESISVKSFRESFGKSGRLDAEYYQPASNALIAKLRKNNCSRLGDVVQMMNGYAWKSNYFRETGDEGYQTAEPFVRIRDCKPGSLDIETLDRLDYEYARGEEIQKAKSGDIVLGMDGLNWFYASLVVEPCYINQRVSWMRVLETSKNITAEYLTLFIDSIAGQTQLLREMTIADTVGHLSNDGIANLVVPILPNQVVKKITKQFRDSFTTKQESKRLLEMSKRAVEVAIENGEEAGLKLLK